MKRTTLTAALAIAALTLTGCSSTDEPTDQPAETSETVEETQAEAPEETEADAGTIADHLMTEVDTISEVTIITEDNDPNDLIGRPTGYTQAAILHDATLACDELGVSCGGTLEIWPDEAAATERSEYIQSTLEEMPILGTEYHYQSGNILLRVAGILKPSQAEAYEAAFNSL